MEKIMPEKKVFECGDQALAALVAQLRRDHGSCAHDLREAADAIDRLRAELASAHDREKWSNLGWAEVAGSTMETYAGGPGNLPACVRQMAERYQAERDAHAATRAELEYAYERGAARESAEAKLADVLRRVRDTAKLFDRSHGGTCVNAMKTGVPEAFTDTDDSKHGG